MDLTPWNPWKELERVQREAEQLFNRVLEKLRHVVPGPPPAFVPVVDIIETDEEYRLHLSLPGMVEEDVDITLEGKVLIVRGERDAPYDPQGVTVHLRQWRYGYFERRIQLPQVLEPEAIRAAYDAGVLTIRLPRPADGRPGAPAEPSGEAPPRAPEDACGGTDVNEGRDQH